MAISRCTGSTPTREVPVHLLQPDRKLGATVRLSGKSAAGGPVTVRLEPCGMAMARLVGPDGKPLGGRLRGVSVMMAVTPGPPAGSAQVRAGALAADEAALSLVDPVNHGNGPVVDAQGRITLRSLIPGATYRIVDRTAVVARDVGDGPRSAASSSSGPARPSSWATSSSTSRRDESLHGHPAAPPAVPCTTRIHQR